MNRFGFLIHPLGMRDIVRHLPNVAGKRESLVKKILEWTPSYHASDITGVQSAYDGREIEGGFYTVPLFPQQITGLDRNFVVGRILDACRLAEKDGAQIVGLGGYTSVVGSAGLNVAKEMEIAVTSGNSYTTATAIEGATKACELLGLDPRQATVAVVGATGSIGSVCSKILAQRGVGTLLLLGRSEIRLANVAEDIHALAPSVQLETSIDMNTSLRRADLVVSCTSSGGDILQPPLFKTGAVICDVAVPHDVCREVAQLRPDVLVIEGGVCVAPGKNPKFNFDFGFPEGICLACMAETMILTMEGLFEDFSIGRGLQIEKVEEISRLAKKHGFKLAGFRAFDEPITAERIEQVKTLSKERRLDQHSFPVSLANPSEAKQS
ncbi:MAG: shikimate dehydrogenase [bacterium]|nr:shikimate dehydrogenase [bacterium]